MGGNRDGDAQLHAHHIVERSDGGGDELRNLITLCDRCHAEYHENQYLLEDGPPTSPSVFRKMSDLVLIDLLGVKAEDSRAIRREKPEESEQRVEWREEGLDALRDLSVERKESTHNGGLLSSTDGESPPRLYTATDGGILFRLVDRVSKGSRQVCPQCSRDDLSTDWIEWNTRGTAKRVACGSCDTLFQEKVVELNGRPVVDLERVASVFDIQTVDSPLLYQFKRPDLARPEFERRYGTGCPDCENSESLLYSWTWARSNVFPHRRWVCHHCEAAFREAENTLQSIADESEADTSPPSVFWYYVIVVTGLLATVATLLHPPLILVSGLPLALAVYKDIQYVRFRTELTPSARLWTWGTLGLGVPSALAYLANRKRTDSVDSGLHAGLLRSTVRDFVSRIL